MFGHGKCKPGCKCADCYGGGAYGGNQFVHKTFTTHIGRYEFTKIVDDDRQRHTSTLFTDKLKYTWRTSIPDTNAVIKDFQKKGITPRFDPYETADRCTQTDFGSGSKYGSGSGVGGNKYDGQGGSGGGFSSGSKYGQSGSGGGFSSGSKYGQSGSGGFSNESKYGQSGGSSGSWKN